ncbi:MAG: O-antigen ligase family protein [Thermoleophilia bacterium]
MSEGSTRRLAWLALSGAVLALFFTAFEILEPLFSIGPVSFTTSEIAAVLFLVSLAPWAFRAGRSFYARRPLDLAVVLFVASNFLSSFFADDRPGAIKFSIRMAFAALVYFGISRLPGRKYRSHLVVAGAVTVTLMVVTVIGLLETYLLAKHYSSLLSPFQQATTTFGTFYNVRTTATMSFPTVLSFYLELAFPVALAFALWLIGRQVSIGRQRAVTLAVLAATAMVMAVQLFTYTRTGMVAMPLSLLLAAAVAYGYKLGPRTWSIFAMGALILLAVTGALLLVSNKMAVRLGLEEQQEVYTAGYTLVSFPLSIAPGSENSATILIKNTSTYPWRVSGRDKVTFSTRWMTYPEMEPVDVEYRINDLPHDVASGEEADIRISFLSPDDPGRYILVLELVKDRVGWFSASGAKPLVVPLDISATGSRIFPVDNEQLDYSVALPVEEAVSRRQLWEAAVIMWRDHPLLGVGSDQFRVRYNEYFPDIRRDDKVRTHNIVLEALANNGLAGLLAMAYLLLLAAWSQLRLLRDSSLDQQFRVFGLALLAVTIVYVLHGTLDYFLWQTGVAFMFFALLGLTSWLSFEARADPRR